MKKLAIIPIILLLLVVLSSTVFATTYYEQVVGVKPTLYACDVYNTTMVADYSNTFARVSTAFASLETYVSISMTGSHPFTYFWNANDNISFAGDLIYASALKYNGSSMVILLDMGGASPSYYTKSMRTENDAGYITTEFASAVGIEYNNDDDELYILYANNKIDVYTIATASLNTWRVVYDRTIYVDPFIETDTLRYIDGYLYFYGNTARELVYTDLNGNYLGRHNINISVSNIDSICKYDSDTWYFIGNQIYYELSDTLPEGVYTYIDGEYYTQKYCLEDNYLCNNAIYIDTYDGFYINCDLDDRVYCDSACLDATGTDGSITYNTGYCEPSTCDEPSPCFNTERRCSAYGEYQICGNFDDDLCFEWGVETSCFPNQYCSTGYCYEINYSEVDSYVSYPEFYIVPEVVNDDTTSSVKSTNKITISTTNNAHTQKFKTLTSDPSTVIYTAINCEYEDVKYIVDIDASIENSTSYNKEYTLNSQSSVLEINLSVLPNTNGTFNIVLSDDALGEGINLQYEIINAENKITMCEYNSTANNCSYTFFQRDNAGVEIDISEIFIEIYYDFDGNYYVVKNTIYESDDDTTTYTTINRETLTDYFNEITIENNLSKSLTVNTFDAIALPIVKPSFKQYSKTYYQISCVYDAKGCYDARFYVIGNNVSSYLNYKDYEVCISSISSSVNEVATQNAFDKFSTYPLIIRLFALLLILGVTFYFFFVNEEMKDFAMSKWIGVFFMIVIVFAFTILKVIPPYIIALMFILTAGLGMIFFRKSVFGG